MILCESDNDALVYQAAIEAGGLRDETFCGSGGGCCNLANMVRRNAGEPIAVIADFDVLTQGEACRILAALQPDPDLGSYFDALGPQWFDYRHGRGSLTKNLINSWLKLDDAAAGRRLRSYVHLREWIQNAHVDGLAACQPAQREVLQDCLNACASGGLFIVPNGALESWCPQLCPVQSRRSRKSRWKTRFARRLASEIRCFPELAGDIIEFMARVVQFLEPAMV